MYYTFKIVYLLVLHFVFFSVAQAATLETTRVSVDSIGNEGNSVSFIPSISSDGRYVAFRSSADNLVLGDANNYDDIFVHDWQTGQTTRVSVNSYGIEGNEHSFAPAISGDGRYVAFESRASNLVSGDMNGTRDIFVHDRLTGQTNRVSIDSNGNESNYNSWAPDISSDGRYITFDSNNRFDGGPFDGRLHLFVHDRQTGQTTLISTGAYFGSISTNGMYVAFVGYEVIGGIESNDIFVQDRLTNQTTKVSIDSNGNEANANSFNPRISGDGRYVAFWSEANNLVPGDTNGVADIFVHDLQMSQTTRVSVDSNGNQGNSSWTGIGSNLSSISADGRYVAFESASSNLVSGDTNEKGDVFLHDRQTGQTARVSVDSSGNESIGYSGYPSISGDGSYVAFSSDASNLVSGDTNGMKDIFVRGPRRDCTGDPVLLGSSNLFSSIQGAYDFISTGGVDTISLHAVEFTENLLFDRGVTITLKGGYDCDFNEPPFSFSTIDSLVITNGKVNIENIVIRSQLSIDCLYGLTFCTISDDCTAAGGYWWSDDTCMGVPESETVVSEGGRIWMDRNLGASQVATSSTDSLAYGDLYQWGRETDGHQLRTSATTTTTSSTDNPGHGDFIINSNSPYDWRLPANENLWQGIDEINNPCPAGFRLPTGTEWETERFSWSSNDSAGGFASPLKLVVGGGRAATNGMINTAGSYGNFWTSAYSVVGGPGYLRISSDNASSIITESTGLGFSVRCIKD